jgi:hypothetical protein
MRLTENALLSGHATNGFLRHGLVDRAKLTDFVGKVLRASLAFWWWRSQAGAWMLVLPPPFARR